MHLYDRQGNPVYKVPYADPSRGMRDSTLGDAKKLGLVPSVTEIIKVMSAPGLELWKMDRAIDAAAENPCKGKTASGKYRQFIRHKSQEIANRAADKGDKIHNALEKFYLGDQVPLEYLTLVREVDARICEEIGIKRWQAEKSFASPIGYGGKVDLSATDGSVVLDFKTKEEIIPGKTLGYDNHIIQLAAYRVGLKYYKARVYNVFISWDGDVVIVPWSEEETQRGWSLFIAGDNLFCLSKNFNQSGEAN